MANDNQKPQKEDHLTNEPLGPARVVRGRNEDGIVVDSAIVTGRKDAESAGTGRDSGSKPEAE